MPNLISTPVHNRDVFTQRPPAPDPLIGAEVKVPVAWELGRNGGYFEVQDVQATVWSAAEAERLDRRVGRRKTYWLADGQRYYRAYAMDVEGATH